MKFKTFAQMISMLLGTGMFGGMIGGGVNYLINDMIGMSFFWPLVIIGVIAIQMVGMFFFIQDVKEHG